MHTYQKKSYTAIVQLFFMIQELSFSLLYLFHDSLESLRIVHGEVSEHLTVNLDASLRKFTHQGTITHTLQTGSCVDTLNPQAAESALLVTTVTISIGQTLLPSVLGYCPNILTGSKVATGELQNSLTLCS